MSKPVEDGVNANLEEFLNTCNEKITPSLDKHAPFRKCKKKSGQGGYGLVKNYKYREVLSEIEKDSGGNICIIIHGLPLR